jgi:hypothetical protein
LLIRFDAKEANKAILFVSKRINIRFIFTLNFEPNVSSAPEPSSALYIFLSASDRELAWIDIGRAWLTAD